MAGQGAPASSVRPPASGSAGWQTGAPHVEYHRSATPPELPELPPDELPLADPSELDVLGESVAASAPCPGDEVLHPIVSGSNTPAPASTDTTIRNSLFFMSVSPFVFKHARAAPNPLDARTCGGQTVVHQSRGPRIAAVRRRARGGIPAERHVGSVLVAVGRVLTPSSAVRRSAIDRWRGNGCQGWNAGSAGGSVSTSGPRRRAIPTCPRSSDGSARASERRDSLPVVRPEERETPASAEGTRSGRVEPAGASPAPVSVGAPGSRPQPSSRETAGRAGRQEPVRWREPRSGEQARGPQHQVKPAASSELQWESRAEHVAAKATFDAPGSGQIRASSLLGVEGAARVQGSRRNRRDPSAQPRSGTGGSYKPKAKASAAQRESEGTVVVTMAATNNATGAKGPCGGQVEGAGKREGMACESGPNHPGGREPDAKVRQLHGTHARSAS
jgi:hypothetical protein